MIGPISQFDATINEETIGSPGAGKGAGEGSGFGGGEGAGLGEGVEGTDVLGELVPPPPLPQLTRVVASAINKSARAAKPDRKHVRP